VDHDQPVLAAVRADIIQIKPVREIEVKLDCSALPPRPMASLTCKSILGP